jgi:nucleoprotein TPR
VLRRSHGHFRVKDLAAQNSILHNHLENVSTQATRIRQAADAQAAIPNDADATTDADAKLSELRSVVAYLRKEKEIVDLQLELSKQETVRLKSQIEHLNASLEETRATLSQVRKTTSSFSASCLIS